MHKFTPATETNPVVNRKMSRIGCPLFLFAVLLAPSCRGFVGVVSLHQRPRQLANNADPSRIPLPLLSSSSGSSNDDDEQDLFDYFDPLRSPHDYPDGIGPDSKPQSSRNDNDSDSDIKREDDGGSRVPMGLDLFASEFPAAFTSPPPDLEVVSNGPEAKVLDENQKKFASSGAAGSDSRSRSGSREGQKEEIMEDLDLFDVFDPTLSPHSYPNGIPSTKREKQSKVGILLMDHGSRNKASNQRLHALATLYQETMFQSSSSSSDFGTAVIVKAAHMEIAEPSIPEVLKALVEEGVDEIICHPYFLSPGRHVVEDIPEIVDGAIKDLNIQIPVITTNPVGSSTDLMINAIHSLVQQSSTKISTLQSSPQRRKLGF